LFRALVPQLGHLPFFFILQKSRIHCHFLNRREHQEDGRQKRASALAASYSIYTHRQAAALSHGRLLLLLLGGEKVAFRTLGAKHLATVPLNGSCGFLPCQIKMGSRRVH